MLTTTRPSDLLSALRGDPRHRPAADFALGGGLRAWLEDDLHELAGSLSAELWLTPRSIALPTISSVPSVTALARGALLSALVAQRAAGIGVEHPMDDALSALEADPRRHELVQAIHELDADAFAQLAAELAAHDVVVARQLTGLPASWLPRTSVRSTIPLAGGAVVLAMTVDLVVGPPASSHASSCLVDVTTAPLGEDAQKRLAIMALIETLRAGTPPLRCATLSTSDGTFCVLDVDDASLLDARQLVVSRAAERSVGT